MKRIGSFFSIALMLMVGMTGMIASLPARAQSDSLTETALSRDWTVRMGVWYANSHAVRSKIGAVAISGLVERQVYAGNSYAIHIGIGYNGFNTVYSVPIMANIIAYHGNLRYGVGAGYYFGKRLSGRGASGSALDLILGYQITNTSNPLSLDLRYFFLSGASNELDGYGLTLGYKF